MRPLFDPSGLGRLYVICGAEPSAENPRYLFTRLESGKPYSCLSAWHSKARAERQLEARGLSGHVVTRLSKAGLEAARAWHAKSGLRLFLEIDAGT